MVDKDPSVARQESTYNLTAVVALQRVLGLQKAD